MSSSKRNKYQKWLTKLAPQVKAFQYLRFTVKKLRNDTTAEGGGIFEKRDWLGKDHSLLANKNHLIKGKDVFLSEFFFLF